MNYSSLSFLSAISMCVLLACGGAQPPATTTHESLVQATVDPHTPSGDVPGDHPDQRARSAWLIERGVHFAVQLNVDALRDLATNGSSTSVLEAMRENDNTKEFTELLTGLSRATLGAFAGTSTVGAPAGVMRARGVAGAPEIPLARIMGSMAQLFPPRLTTEGNTAIYTVETTTPPMLFMTGFDELFAAPLSPDLLLEVMLSHKASSEFFESMRRELRAPPDVLAALVRARSVQIELTRSGFSIHLLLDAGDTPLTARVASAFRDELLRALAEYEREVAQITSPRRAEEAAALALRPLVPTIRGARFTTVNDVASVELDISDSDRTLVVDVLRDLLRLDQFQTRMREANDWVSTLARQVAEAAGARRRARFTAPRTPATVPQAAVTVPSTAWSAPGWRRLGFALTTPPGSATRSSTTVRRSLCAPPVTRMGTGRLPRLRPPRHAGQTGLSCWTIRTEHCRLSSGSFD